MSREELKPSEWAPERIYLQREHGEGGSHTWCEDSVGDGDLIEEAEYVRVGAQDVARAPEGAVELLRKFMEYRDSDYVPNVLFDRARTIIDFAPAAPAVVPYSAPFTTDVPQCCESPETCDEPCWNPQYDIQEAREILENMVRNVESGGNYSENTTCCFLRQALQCLPLAAPAQAEQQAEALCAACSGSGWVTRDPDIGTDRECSVCGGTGVLEDEQQGDGGATCADQAVYQAIADNYAKDLRGSVPAGWREVIDSIEDNIGAGACGIQASSERSIVKPHLDAIRDDLEGLEQPSARVELSEQAVQRAVNEFYLTHGDMFSRMKAALLAASAAQTGESKC